MMTTMKDDMMKAWPVQTFTDNDDMMQACIYSIDAGFSVALFDLDSGETVQTIHIFKEYHKAVTFAKTIVNHG